MSHAHVAPRPVVLACLVAAPVLELGESVLSPLDGTSTSRDLAAISGHQGAFVTSVLLGVAATLLYVPAFLGLARACVAASPRAALTGAVAATAAMLGFMGVRMVSAVELQAVRDGLDRRTAAGLVDHLASNPLGVSMLVLLLLGSLVGLVALAVAGWRAGLPRPALLLMGTFPVVDLLLPSQTGTITSHLLLLVGMAWLALALRRGAAVPEVTPAPLVVGAELSVADAHRSEL